MSVAEATIHFVVPETHPSLPGHFPGHPIVPGVVLLGLVCEAARREFGLGPPIGLPRAKFAAPVLPGRTVTALLTRSGPTTVTFTCRVEGTIVLTGDARFAD